MARYLDRDERIALQDEDGDDPSSDVYVNTGTKVTSYHNDPDCTRVLSSPETMTRKAA